MKRSVLVTGASSGIGRVCAERLAHAEWQVFAGVRDVAANQAWADTTGATLVRVDVIDGESIKAAVADVLDATGGSLDALVANAGVPSAGPIEFVPLPALRDVLEVNVVGQVAVVQAVMPALRAARGRIVFMSSVSGRVAFPFLGPYAASKHAVEAVADSLRREVAQFGVRVSLIEPGNIATAIWDKGLSQRSDLPVDAERVYGAGLDFAQTQGERSARVAIPPDRVADAVLRAVTDKRPRSRYVVGRDARVLVPLATHLPSVVDRVISIAMQRAGT